MLSIIHNFFSFPFFSIRNKAHSFKDNSKIEMLSSVQKLQTILGIIQYQQSSFGSRYFPFLIKFVIILILFTFCLLSVLFVTDKVHQDSSKVVTALLQVTISMSVIFPYFWLIFRSKLVQNTFQLVKLTVEKRYSIDNMGLYAKAEKYSNFVVKYPINLFLISYCLGFFAITIAYFVRDLIRNNINTLEWLNFHFMR